MFGDDKNCVSGKMWCSGEINQSGGGELCQSRSRPALKPNIREFPPLERIFQREIYKKKNFFFCTQIWREYFCGAVFWFLLDAPYKTHFVLDFLVSCLGVFPACGSGRVEVEASAESETETPAWLRYCLHFMNRNHMFGWNGSRRGLQAEET